MLCQIVFLVFLSIFQLAVGQGTYKAAVVEYAARSSDTPRNTILTNLNDYEQYAEAARQQGVNIIVFPEYGLTQFIKDPEEYAIDLENSNEEILKRLKNIAFEHKIYLVVNLLEKSNKTNGSIHYYNTNLVINDNNAIIAKYRKINLYEEPKLTPGNKATTFDTGFGVRFGIFTCADILYDNPAKVLPESGITDIIFPTMWFSTLPFYHSLSVQHGYAQANGVNLLAANYGNPTKGYGGSGIYNADGTFKELYIDASTSSKLIIATLNKLSEKKDNTCTLRSVRGFAGGNSLKPNITQYFTTKDFQSSKYKFKDLDLSENEISKEICHNSFCCTFNISVTDSNSNEVYKLVAFNGDQELNDEEIPVKFCSLLACKSNSVDTCGERINGTTLFKRIQVTSNLPLSDNETFYQPTTLTFDLLPIESQYCGSVVKDEFNARLLMDKAQDKIITFGIWGRGSANTYSAGIILMISLIVMKFIFN